MLGRTTQLKIRRSSGSFRRSPPVSHDSSRWESSILKSPMNPTRARTEGTIEETPPVMLSMREVLAEKQFRRLWLGQLVSIFGDFVALFAVQVAITFRMHGTAEDVTGVMVAYLGPLALIGPIAGVFVDRWNPRRTMIASDLTRGGLIILLAFTSHLWQIYGILFAISTVSSFFMPAQSVTVPLLVKREGHYGCQRPDAAARCSWCESSVPPRPAHWWCGLAKQAAITPTA